MKIIAINGSPRKHGATAKIVKKMVETLTELGNEVELVHISDINHSFCLGCARCYRLGHCVLNDEAEALSIKIEHADGIVIGSPTYESYMSGQLKAFIDRGHFVMEQLLHNKYAVTIVTGENYGSRKASKALNDILLNSGAMLTGKIVYNLPFNKNPLAQKKIMDKIKTLSYQMNQDMKEKKIYPFQKLKHHIIFKYGIQSFVKKNKEAYQGVIKRWNKNKIV